MSLVLGLLVFIIVVLFLLPGCAGEPAVWALALEEEAAYPLLGWAAHDLEVVGY